MIWSDILILVLIAVVSIYLLGGLFVFSSVVFFSSKIRERRNTLSILLMHRIENVKSFYEYLQFNNIEISNHQKYLLESTMDFDRKKYLEDSKDFVDKIIYVEQSLVSTISKNDITLSSESETYMDTLNDLNEQYRINVTYHNSDAKGYNYWIRALLYRYIYTIFKYKEVKELS